MTLRIEYEVYPVGRAAPSEEGRFGLEYDAAWPTLHFAFPLSQSLPFTQMQWPSRVAHNYFANLLPEGLAREAVCDRLGISFDNDVALLSALGGDTAGACRFVDEKAGTERAERARTPLSERTLEEWAEGAPALPGPDEPVRLSLAGAQHKTSAVRDDDGWALPGSGEASTHILKFDSVRFPHLSVNEFLVTRFAGELGLSVTRSFLDAAGNRPFLVVERYDRVAEVGSVERLHQEDFCQVFGMPPSRKYEAEGGTKLGSIAQKLRELSAQPAADLQMLLRWAIFGALAGNADGHAKNLSLLYTGRRITLAPLYDLVCTRAFPKVDRRLAFAIGGERDPDKLRTSHWNALAADFRVRPRLVVAEVERQLDEWEAAWSRAIEQLPEHIDAPDVIATIRRSTDKRARALERGLKG